jgi:branched-chain amino acid transport system permease protein
MRGVYFTIGTWIVAEALLIFCTNWKFVNYSIGYNVTIAYAFSPRIIYVMSFVIGIGSVVLVYALLRSRTGLALMAMRDNESAAEVRGVILYRTKLKCFLISAAYTGITGAVMYLNLAFVKPSSAFSIDWTVSMVFIVIIGGIGTIEGPIIGAVIYILIRQYLYNFPGISMIILGAIAVVMILVMPKGIMGTLHDKFGLEIFSVRRSILWQGAGRHSLREILMKE